MPATLDHARAIRLRRGDARELDALGVDHLRAFESSMSRSLWAQAYLIDGEVAALVGLAVDSLLLTLGGRVDDLALGRPFALGLPNVWHLATDATARLTAGTTALDLVEALHPTAAVAGAPRDAALALIEQLEPFDRGRYAGPVGWIGATGDGEWAIGLRSAQIESSDRVRAYAGAGIVAASVARSEFLETGWKFAPVLEALGLPLSAATGPRADSDQVAVR